MHDDAVADGELDPRDLSRGEVLTLLIAVPVGIAGIIWALVGDFEKPWPALVSVAALGVGGFAWTRFQARRDELAGIPKLSRHRGPLELALNILGLGLVVAGAIVAIVAVHSSVIPVLFLSGLVLTQIADVRTTRRAGRPMGVSFSVLIATLMFASAFTLAFTNSAELRWLRIVAAAFFVVVLVVAVVVGRKIVRAERNAARHRPPPPKFF